MIILAVWSMGHGHDDEGRMREAVTDTGNEQMRAMNFSFLANFSGTDA
jgi:hypothetical protein